jgi:hypothetical protein
MNDPTRPLLPDDMLTPSEARKVRRALKQVRDGTTTPWSVVKDELGLNSRVGARLAEYRQAAERLRALRKGVTLGGVSVKELSHQGHRY